MHAFLDYSGRTKINRCTLVNICPIYICAAQFWFEIQICIPLKLSLCSTDTDTCIGIGPIRIRGYVIFPKNPIRGYVLIFLETNNIIY